MRRLHKHNSRPGLFAHGPAEDAQIAFISVLFSVCVCKYGYVIAQSSGSFFNWALLRSVLFFVLLVFFRMLLYVLCVLCEWSYYIIFIAKQNLFCCRWKCGNFFLSFSDKENSKSLILKILSFRKMQKCIFLNKNTLTRLCTINKLIDVFTANSCYCKVQGYLISNRTNINTQHERKYFPMH